MVRAARAEQERAQACHTEQELGLYVVWDSGYDIGADAGTILLFPIDLDCGIGIMGGEARARDARSSRSPERSVRARPGRATSTIRRQSVINTILGLADLKGAGSLIKMNYTSMVVSSYYVLFPLPC